MTTPTTLPKLCDSNCNECPLVIHPNSRMITRILNELIDIDVDNVVYLTVQNLCPNLTVCYDCRIDDFCHVEGCQIMDMER